ncbi:MAG: DMT family transporter [Verrucomicrobiae bacterium]|nr:DMT family transporter [Verrucomicrobiae bacterium]
MSEKTNNSAIAGGLLLTVVLWGGNNAGTKWLVSSWPPVFTGGTRFLLAGFILLGVLRFTSLLGRFEPLTRRQYGSLWLRGGLSLAVYVVTFTWAFKLTAASHVALYMGASPVWALLIEERPRPNWSSVRRYGAALLALSGVMVLFWPALKAGDANINGELLGLVASVLWANFSHQSRILAAEINGLEVAANAMWMAGATLLPIALYEARNGIKVDARHIGVQTFCIFLGSVVPYAFWNTALRHWLTSRVLLFNNLIPLTTTLWVYFTLGEAITPTFWMAMVLVIAGVLLGQMDWSKIFKMPESF